MSAEDARSSWLLPNAVLAVVTLLLLVAAYVVVGRDEAGASDGDGRATTVSRAYDEVTAAASTEVTAFLSVDYRDPDPLIQKVLDGSTGMFRQQYSRSVPRLRTSTRQRESVATARVRSVGVGRLDADRATVLVAADSRVRNTKTDGKAQPRYYRLELGLVRQHGRWLTSTLRFVG